MSATNSRDLGARIGAARERAGIKQGQLGELVGLDRTAINRIENGARRVTAVELSDIAHALGVRMSSFFQEPLPALVSHRSSQGHDTADSKIDQLLARLGTEVELIQELAPQELGLADLSSRLSKMPYPQPRTAEAAEQLAAEARRLLGLEPEEKVGDLVEVVASVGLLAFSLDLGVDTADAGTIALGLGGVSLVNSHSKVGRRRLALAHELGHYLVADEYTIDWRVSDKDGGDIETRLDRFARAVLLPEAGLRSVWSKHSGEHELRDVAVLVASEFRVDMATLARRTQELGMASAEEAAEIRNTATTQTDIVDFGLYVPTDMQGTSLPVRFKKAVLRLFREERISRERALELLFGTFEESDLPPLRTRREDELWNFVS